MTISSRFKFTGTCLCSVSDVLADHGLSGLSHATRLRVEQPDEVSEIEEKQHDHNQAAADEVEMGHGCWRGGGRRRWRNEGSVAVGTPLTGVRHSRETGGTANVPRYRARGGHRILYRERPAAGPTETGIRRLCPAEWTRLRAVGNRGRCKHVLERALDETCGFILRPLSPARELKPARCALSCGRCAPRPFPAGWPACHRRPVPGPAVHTSRRSADCDQWRVRTVAPRPWPRATTADCSDSHSRRCCSAVQCTWQYPDGCNVVFRQRRPPSVRITPEQVVRRCVRAVCGITPTPELIPRCPYTQRTVRAQARLHQRSEVQRRTAHTVLRVPRTVECRGQGS